MFHNDVTSLESLTFFWSLFFLKNKQKPWKKNKQITYICGITKKAVSSGFLTVFRETYLL